jgi:acyl-[acyl-carrier-protein] desaturase
MVDDRAMLAALTPRLHELVERHLETTKEWFPHELVPWSRGRDFEPDEAWDASEFEMADGVRSALFVNLLTEDNLPHYFETINRVFGDEAWRVWARRWTAEEMRHSTVIRDYATVTRALDPVALERARMSQVAGGVVPQPTTVLDGLAYVALQELATRVAHRNTGKLLDDPVGYEVMARVGADENLHYLLYRDLVSAAIELEPSAAVEAIERQVRDFEMPGTGIPGFTRHAAAIARAGIYDLPTHHEQIVAPVVLRHWKVDRLEGLTPEGEAARCRVLELVEQIGTAAQRQAERRERRREAALSRA